jgi:hypothetical protein
MDLPPYSSYRMPKDRWHQTSPLPPPWKNQEGINQPGPPMQRTITIILVAFLAVAGCANMSTTQQRVLSGGAIGAGSGAVIGALAGSAALGAAAGGGAGLLAGFIYDQAQKPR